MKSLLASLLIVGTVALPAVGEETIDLEVEVNAVDDFAGQIELKRGESTARFTVPTDTPITIDGRVGKFSDLKKGQTGIIKYESASKSIVAITILGAEGPSIGNTDSPELSVLNELGVPSTTSIDISEGGLEIFWDENGIQTATRQDKAPSTLFAGKKPYIDGRHLTKHGDTAVLLLKKSGRQFETLHEVEIAGGSRQRATEIQSLVPRSGRVFSPYLAMKGELLVFAGRLSGKPPAIFASRRNASNQWAPAEIILAETEVGNSWSSAWMSDDGLIMLAASAAKLNEEEFPHNLFVFRRSSPEEPFLKPELLNLPGINSLVFNSPRYLVETKELFLLVQDRSEVGKPTRSPAVIRNVKLLHSGAEDKGN